MITGDVRAFAVSSEATLGLDELLLNSVTDLQPVPTGSAQCPVQESSHLLPGHAAGGAEHVVDRRVAALGGSCCGKHFYGWFEDGVVVVDEVDVAPVGQVECLRPSTVPSVYQYVCTVSNMNVLLSRVYELRVQRKAPRGPQHPGPHS